MRLGAAPISHSSAHASKLFTASDPPGPVSSAPAPSRVLYTTQHRLRWLQPPIQRGFWSIDVCQFTARCHVGNCLPSRKNDCIMTFHCRSQGESVRAGSALENQYLCLGYLEHTLFTHEIWQAASTRGYVTDDYWEWVSYQVALTRMRPLPLKLNAEWPSYVDAHGSTTSNGASAPRRHVGR